MLQLRELGPDDAEFLGEMLYAALFWTPRKERLPIELVLAHPEISIFHEAGAGRATWGSWRRSTAFPSARPGTGSSPRRATARDTSTSRRPSSRSRSSTAGAARGSERALMEALADRARADGIEQISLSVDADNPARQLYARLGYAEYEPGDGLGRMLLKL